MRVIALLSLTEQKPKGERTAFCKYHCRKRNIREWDELFRLKVSFITREKKDRNRSQVYLDGNYFFICWSNEVLGLASPWAMDWGEPLTACVVVTSLLSLTPSDNLDSRKLGWEGGGRTRGISLPKSVGRKKHCGPQTEMKVLYDFSFRHPLFPKSKMLKE